MNRGNDHHRIFIMSSILTVAMSNLFLKTLYHPIKSSIMVLHGPQQLIITQIKDRQGLMLMLLMYSSYSIVNVYLLKVLYLQIFKM